MMDYSALNRYLSGNASEVEIKELFDWVEASAENKNTFIQYKKIWALTNQLDRDITNGNFQRFKKKINKSRRFSLIYKRFGYAAAILLVLSLGTFLYHFIPSENKKPPIAYQADTRIEVPAGQMSKVVLPDGTIVQLNSGTILTYAANFNSGERTLKLDGEAFFEVAKDTSHPFLVKTRTLDFKVYGTSFNIQAYKEEKNVNATLVEGSLGVFGKSGTEYSRLKPGQNIQYDYKTNRLRISTVDISMYTSWKNGYIIFQNESLKEIAKKIERWYNVEIIIKNEKLANELYMGTILKNKPVDQILEALRLTSSLRYRIIQRPDKPTLIYWE